MRWPGRLPEEDETLTTRPHPARTITGIAARISRIGAITWISHCACQSSSVSSSIGRTAAGAGVVDEDVEAAEALAGRR